MQRSRDRAEPGVFEKLAGGQCGWSRVIKRERLGGEGRERTKGEDFALTLESGVDFT